MDCNGCVHLGEECQAYVIFFPMIHKSDMPLRMCFNYILSGISAILHVDMACA
jgi:hypothetical protein